MAWVRRAEGKRALALLMIAAIVCGAAGGQFQLNIMMPVMGAVTLESVRLLAGATEAFTTLGLEGLEANEEACQASVEKSLAMVTGLNPYIGYERAAALAARLERK